MNEQQYNDWCQQEKKKAYRAVVICIVAMITLYLITRLIVP